MKIKRILSFMLILILLISISFIVQGQIDDKEKAKQLAERDKLITKIFKIQYADAKELLDILMPFSSRLRDENRFAIIVVNEHFNIITVTDYPGKIAVIEEVIKQFDIKPVEVEFTFHLLEALDKPAPPSEKPLPPDIQPILNKLKTNFAYKTYNLLDTASFRSSGSSESSIRLGGFSENALYINIEWSLLSPGSSTIQISELDIGKAGHRGYRILNTSLTLEDGKPVVVGTSKPSADDKALITIIKAQIVKD